MPFPNCTLSRFQWASLQIAQLLELLRERDIRDRLGKLPETLEEAYNEIYARIQAQKGSAPDIANRVFQWVICSCSPLTPAELVTAVCQDPETDVIDPVDIDTSIVLAACHNLLVVDQELGVCRLSHLSVQEYFERRWSQSQANSLVAKVCRLMLNDPAQQELNPGLISEHDQNRGMSDLIQYAALHWATHVQRHGEESIDGRLPILLKRFLGSMNKSGPAYRSWHKMITTLFEDRPAYIKFWSVPLYRVYGQLVPPSTPSFAICSFGFYQILLDWWVFGFINVDQRNYNNASLLQIAAKAGHEVVVRLLLEAKADVEAKDNYGQTALYCAAQDGHEEVVRLLLEAKADIEAKNNDGWTALHWAVWDGHKEVVRLLLEAKADVEAKDNDGWTALHKAAWHGHEDVVRLLLEAKADVEAKDNEGQTALYRAAWHGRKEVLRLLFKAKADVEAKDNDGWTALH